MKHSVIHGEVSSKWCILRTSPGRTLGLAESLEQAGYDVWTPVQVIKRRRPRSHKTFERSVPIAPTFVFARAHQIADLVEIVEMPISPHPLFSIFRHAGRVPLVADCEISGFRTEEERERVRKMKTTKRQFEPGQRVRVIEGIAMGMTGIVERGKGKEPIVNFGGGFTAKISSWLLNLQEVEQTGTNSVQLPRAA